MRLLCLHGARANSDITRLQLSSLGLDQLGHELDCIDAPLEAETSWDGQGQGRSWQQVGESTSKEVLAQELRTSLRFVIKHVREHGPYDGAFGFSQGAAIVTLLSDPGVRKSMIAGPDQPLWDFVVLACGVDYLVAQKQTDMEGLLTLPSLHILGEADLFKKQSEELLGRYERPHVLRHAFGHELPLTLRTEHPDLLHDVAQFVSSPGVAPTVLDTGLSIKGLMYMFVPLLLLLFLGYEMNVPHL